MRLTFPLTAALVAATLTLPHVVAAQSTLKPFQEAAIQKVLATMEPQMRPLARPQLEAQFGMMNEAQIAAILAGLEQNLADMEAAEEETYPEATEEDLAFNRAQVEPVLRQLFEAQLAFDRLVTRAVAEGLPAKEYAVWGQAWRASLAALNPDWLRSTPDFALFRMQFDGMVPTDGRYRFTLPAVRSDFDEAAIRAAIAGAARDYAALGERFVEQARTLANAGKFDDVYALERQMNAQAAAISQKLSQDIALQAPTHTPLMLALQQGEQIRG